MSYTPGPWEASDWQVAAWPNGRLDIICHTALNKSQRTEENKANARLIAAAPELLEACKVALRHIDFHTPVDSAIHVRRVLHGVIAKAEVAS